MGLVPEIKYLVSCILNTINKPHFDNNVETMQVMAITHKLCKFN